ncbi:recombinase family protein [Amycolatopsis sp. NPDC051758]|uniref:recombinase family protein n=1 Tax=Amycolatopsis sp. NPDC051758 TaxID=3363935 RepID=UPI0037BB476D
MSVFPQLQELADRLKAQPRVVAPAAEPLLAYGYVRTPELEPSYADTCADLLTSWSAACGWQLGVVFRDVGVGSCQLRRPGFTGFLDVLALPQAALALALETPQLARRPEEAIRLGCVIRRTGVDLRVLAEELAATPS